MRRSTSVVEIPAPVVERYACVLGRRAGDQLVEIAGDTLGGNWGNIELSGEETKDFVARGAANENITRVVVEESVYRDGREAGGWSLQDNGSPNLWRGGELDGLCCGSVEETVDLRLAEHTFMARLGLDPDGGVAQLYDAIVKSFGHQMPSRRDAGPLPDENQRGDQMLVVESASGPRAGTSRAPLFEGGRMIVGGFGRHGEAIVAAWLGACAVGV